MAGAKPSTSPWPDLANGGHAIAEPRAIDVEARFAVLVRRPTGADTPRRMSAHEDEGRRAGAPRSRVSRGVRRLLVALAATAVAAIGAELALRYLLFADLDTLEGLGKRLRRESLYATTTESDYFKLQALFHRDEVRPVARPDSKLGWASIFDPRTFEHPDEARIGGRRPVLLYGDSNAQCMTAPEHCFQGLMERSEFADRLALVNYGAAGFGLDQIYMTLRGSIDRFVERDPIVVIGVLVEDDLARSILDFRGWPKPSFGVRDGQLVEPAELDVDVDRYLAEHPPAISSYVARLVSRRLFGAPSGDFERLAEVNRPILEAMREELESRRIEYFFLLFGFDESVVRSPVERASRAVLDEFFERRAVRSVDVFDYMRAICDPEWRCLDELVGRNDPVLRGHLNDGGNKLAFEALRQGLEGRFGDVDEERLRGLARAGAFRSDPENAPWSQLLGRKARAVTASSATVTRWDPALVSGPLPRLALSAADAQGIRFEIELDPVASRVSARVRAVRTRSAPRETEALSLVVTVDGVEALRETYAIGAEPQALSIDVSRARRLDLRVEAVGEPSNNVWLELLDFDLRPPG